MTVRYQVGGSVASESSYYLTREADESLYQSLHQGELCYVFNSRQMGKSSLLLSVKKRLQNDGVKCCFIDMSRIGSVNITLEQWYAGIISELWRGFELPPGRAMVDWWKTLGELSPSQKLSIFLEQMLVDAYPEQDFCLFFDEIDSILSLPFAADDFFSLLRASYNKRADDARFNRLTFSFFGVTQPAELMRNVQRSPFNIGKAISLEGFTYQEALPLTQGLSDSQFDKNKLLERILFWSNGQPFLTQKICKLTTQITHQAIDEKQWIDQLVQDNILDHWQSQDNPEHLKTIADRLVLNEQYSVQLLSSYLQVIDAPNNNIAIDDVKNFERLYLTGLLANIDNHVSPRTRIYQHIFNKQWLLTQLSKHRPYGKKLTLWQKSDAKDDQWLLSNDELEKARVWAKDKNLPDEDYRFFAVSQDKLSAEIQSWNAKLQTEVEQRKAAELALQAALHEVELAKIDAENANQAKSKFLTRVSHEVRTHLNSILGISYIAQQQEYNSQSPFSRINRVANYMHGVVNDMLDIDLLEKSQLQLSRETFYLDDVIDKLTTVMGYQIDKKGLFFHVDFPNIILPTLIGDPLRLEQLLSNLLTNAIKYTDKGGITLSIKAIQKAESPDCLSLCFDIIDTGSGIGNATLKGELNSADTSSLDLGIGLKLCDQLAGLMQGKLYVTSHPKKGSCFHFCVDFPIVHLIEDGLNEHVETSQNIVLLAEESSYHSQQLQQQVTLLGHQISRCSISELTANQLQTVSTFIVTEQALLLQEPLLSALDEYANIDVILLLPHSASFPHWLSVLGYKKRIDYPCSIRHLAKNLSADLGVEANKQSLLTNNVASQSLCVLVVDDDEINQEIVSELLRSIGIKVALASNGLEAIDAIKNNTYQLVLMDIEMPVMGGEEALKQIQQLALQPEYQHLKRLPIVALTANALLDDKKRYLLAGMNDYIAKPIEPSTLIHVVKNWLPKQIIETSNDPVPVLDSVQIKINNINTKSGLLRCNNNAILYRKILLQFANQYQQGLQFHGKSSQQIRQLAHSIKGSSANIGATQLSDLAKQIEHEMQNMQARDEHKLHLFNDGIIATCHDISQALAADHDQASHLEGESDISSELISEKLQKLSALLETDHGLAFAEIEILLSWGCVNAKAIEQAMNDFDSELAAELITNWLTEIN